MSSFQPLYLLAERGQRGYFGEPVTVLEHALQTAALAVAAGASEPLILAALLHDIGHLVHSAGEDASQRGVDPVHEVLGARALRPLYGEVVAEPIRLHVAAKRWLCLHEPGYREGLSSESERSLVLQGGPFTEREASEFRTLAGSGEAIRLRRWDDEAKVPGLQVPPLSSYRGLAAGLRLT